MNIAVLRTPDQISRLAIYPDVPNSATALVKYLSPEERAALFAEVATLEKEGVDKEDAVRLAYGRAAVKGWEGIFDGPAELPFAQENIDFLMLNCVEFRTLVFESATSLRRAAEKNCLTTAALGKSSLRSLAPPAKKRRKKA